MNKNYPAAHDSDFDFLLNEAAEALPPDTVKTVTPWKNSMKLVLLGTALSLLTLNLFGLNYICSAVGTFLTFLGYRSLRGENRMFSACFAISIPLAAEQLALLILNSTVFGTRLLSDINAVTIFAVNAAVMLCELIFLSLALRKVKNKAGITTKTKSALWLVIWYIAAAVLAVSPLGKWTPAALLAVIFYILILFNLFRLPKELEEAGFTVTPVRLRIGNGVLAAVFAALAVTGLTLGFVFGGRYAMDWQPVNTVEETQKSEQALVKLRSFGIPENILRDLSPEDIEKCASATECRIVVSERQNSSEKNETDGLQTTGIALLIPSGNNTRENEVEISGGETEQETETWLIINHFVWTKAPKIYRTDCIQLWQPMNANGVRLNISEPRGRLLCDKDGTTYTSPFYSLEKSANAPNQVVPQNPSDLYAEFSLSPDGENSRGYIMYTISRPVENTAFDCWMNYTHTTGRLIYPLVTAKDRRVNGMWNGTGKFCTLQSRFDFWQS